VHSLPTGKQALLVHQALPIRKSFNEGGAKEGRYKAP